MVKLKASAHLDYWEQAVAGLWLGFCFFHFLRRAHVTPSIPSAIQWHGQICHEVFSVSVISQCLGIHQTSKMRKSADHICHIICPYMHPNVSMTDQVSSPEVAAPGSLDTLLCASMRISGSSVRLLFFFLFRLNLLLGPAARSPQCSIVEKCRKYEQTPPPFRLTNNALVELRWDVHFFFTKWWPKNTPTWRDATPKASDQIKEKCRVDAKLIQLLCISMLWT